MRTLKVTVEPSRPDSHYGGPCYVARDSDGVWVTYGKVDKERSGESLAAYLFHADEVESVTVDDSDATIIVLNY